MLSRVADSMYWMARYRERAENIARLIDVNLFLSIDAPGNAAQQWDPIVSATGDDDLFKELYGDATEAKALKFLTFDEENPNSIYSCLKNSRENARSIRETITTEMWNQLNALYLKVQRTASPKVKRESLFEFYLHIKRSCQLFTGIKDTTMAHNEAWHFGRIGNLIERADQTTRILDVKYYILLPSIEHVGTAYDDILWAAVLQSVSGLETYRQKYHEISPANVVDFLIFDPLFPRSIFSCLKRSQGSLRWISEFHLRKSSPPIEMISGYLDELERESADSVMERGVHEYLEEIQSKLSDFSQCIYDTYIQVSYESTKDSKLKGEA